jgi:hypothetical protein
VLSYDLQVSYDPSMLEPQAVAYDTTGTLSAGMLVTPNISNPAI